MRRSRELISRAIALIHEAGAAPERWSEVLAVMCELLQAPRSGVLDIQVTTGRLTGLVGHGFEPAAQRIYAERYFAIDPTWPLCLESEPWHAMTGYERFSATSRQRNEYFVDFAQANDIGDVIGIGTRVVGGQRTILSLQRTLDAPAFARSDKSLMQLLAPHVEIAKRVEAKIGAALRGKSELAAAFDRLAIPAFVVDGQVRIRHANEAGAAISTRFPQVTLRGGKLGFADPKVNSAFQAAVRNAAADFGCSAVLALPLPAQTTGEILVAPLQRRQAAEMGWDAPLALVSIVPAPHQPHAIAARLQQAYRLTPAEARLAESLALGHSIEEISASSGVSEATLRSQLRAVFAKTGTSRQAQLVRLALTGAVLA
jgi:DNA-binding CsgD family transcriptional regulator